MLNGVKLPKCGKCSSLMVSDMNINGIRRISCMACGHYVEIGLDGRRFEDCHWEPAETTYWAGSSTPFVEFGGK